MEYIKCTLECLNYTTNVLVALIGFGITALIGINIWASLGIDKKIKDRISKEVEFLKEENKKLSDKLELYIDATGCMSLAYMSLSKDEYETAFVLFIKAAIKMQGYNDVKKSDACLTECLNILNNKIEKIEESDYINSEIGLIKETLSQINSTKANDVYAFLFPFRH